MADLNQLVKKLREADEKRQSLRVKLLEAGVADPAGEGELARLNGSIEGCAKQINKHLASCAQAGKAPGAFELPQGLDPELQAFLAEVQKTASHLGKGGGGGTADKTEAARLKRQVEKRKRELTSEAKKTKQAREELKKEGKRLEQEEKKLKDQERRFHEQQKKVGRERDDSAKQQQAALKDKAKAEAEKKKSLAELKKSPSQRNSLERKVQVANNAIHEAGRREQHHGASVKRAEKVLASLERELKQLAEALETLERERKRLKEEDERLVERGKQIDEAQAAEDKRLRQLDQAAKTLSQATA